MTSTEIAAINPNYLFGVGIADVTLLPVRRNVRHWYLLITFSKSVYVPQAQCSYAAVTWNQLITRTRTHTHPRTHTHAFTVYLVDPVRHLLLGGVLSE